MEKAGTIVIDNMKEKVAIGTATEGAAKKIKKA
jgi:hypothetical protein